MSCNMKAIGQSLHPDLPHLSAHSVDSRRKELYCRSTSIAAAAAAKNSDDQQWYRERRRVDKSKHVVKRRRFKEFKALDRGPRQHATELLIDQHATEMLLLLGLMKLESSNSSEEEEEERMPKLLIGFSVMLTVNLPVPFLVAVLQLKDAAKGIIDVMQLNTHNST